VDGPTDRLTIYYGGADTVVCLAHGYLSEVIDFVKARS
jgi:beta-1,4-mannooligosaccharide/beta-1,4-mannosyl-N-acetylglucosamine phosphorylase